MFRYNLSKLFIINYLVIQFNYSNSQIIQQRFVIEPGDQTVVAGRSVTLTCRVANKVGTIQWTRDGFGLGIERNLSGFSRYTMIGKDDEGDYSLEITSVSIEDDAIFQCQVSGSTDNKVPGIRSRSAVLTVLVPPNPPIIVQVQAQGDLLHTTEGTLIELNCEANGGKPAPELNWFYSTGEPVSTKNVTYWTQTLSDGKRFNAQSKWLFIASKEYDNRTVVCRAESTAVSEQLDASIRFDVKYAPEIQIQLLEPIGQTKVGDTIILSCEAKASPNVLLYKWFKNDEIIVGDHETQLTLSAVDRHMNGAVVVCQVSNSVGSNKVSHTLDISYGPILKAPPDYVYGVDLGRDVRLKCDVEGNPKPDITWKMKDKHKVLATEAELVVKDVTDSKAGKYICRAAVKGFSEITSVSIIQINGSPRIHDPYIHYGLLGETVNIGCYIESMPKPSQIVWYHNRQKVTIDTNRGININDNRIPGESTILSTVVIYNAKLSDFGEYNCSVKNKFGIDTQTILLVEKISFTSLVTYVSLLLTALAVIVLLTIFVILYLRRLKRKEFDEKLSHNSSEWTDVSSGSVDDSDMSTDGSVSDDTEASVGVQMKSLSSTEAVHHSRRSQRSRTTPDVLLDYDINYQFKQYI
ncbi:irregular chiasm C-roughest protein-like [Oppia nitens]|uniref:irregular chiasm C-roughest protein-like n=1 Tax=Oppia nitens TaxID=1686743 RepID=UPI0023DCD0F0|nr:irregular chiasm C-roughest protein-like [Oppia nitens]